MSSCHRPSHPLPPPRWCAQASSDHHRRRDRPSAARGARDTLTSDRSAAPPTRRYMVQFDPEVTSCASRIARLPMRSRRLAELVMGSWIAAHSLSFADRSGDPSESGGITCGPLKGHVPRCRSRGEARLRKHFAVLSTSTHPLAPLTIMWYLLDGDGSLHHKAGRLRSDLARVRRRAVSTTTLLQILRIDGRVTAITSATAHSDIARWRSLQR